MQFVHYQPTLERFQPCKKPLITYNGTIITQEWSKCKVSRCYY